MANTWLGLNSSSLAVGPGARGEERRGSREESRWEERGTHPSGFLQQALTLFLWETRATLMTKLDQARLGLVNLPKEIMFPCS